MVQNMHLEMHASRFLEGRVPICGKPPGCSWCRLVGCASARVVRLNTGTGQFKEALERTGATGMKFTEV